jgi:pyruvate dehydrogenase E1 component
MAATIPNCIPYDPTFAHELAVIMHDGLKRMVEKQEDVFYYITVMNENYAHPGLKPGTEQDILKGLYLLQEGDKKAKKRVQLMGSGTILREAIAAVDLLKNDWGVEADVWSAPSFTLLARDGQDVERWNLLHPTETPRLSHVAAKLQDTKGPIIATSDYMHLFAEQIRPFMPKGRNYKVLGTDGFGRSDTRAKLREFFEVNRYFVTVSALKALAEDGEIDAKVVADAIKKYGIDPNKPNPATL